MSEQMADHSGDLSCDPIDAWPHVSSPSDGALTETDSAPVSTESPKIVPEHVGSEVPQVAPKTVASTDQGAEAAAPRTAGKVMIMAPSHNNAWEGDAARDHSTASGISSPSDMPSGGRRLSALAAVVALAAVAGAIGGSLVTSGIGHVFAVDDARMASVQSHVLEDAIQRLDSDVAALKANVEHTAKLGVAQANKTNDRIDKVEKAQIEPAAKLARLGETLEKLRVAAASPPAAQPVLAATNAKDVTGSIPSAEPVPIPAPKPEIARLPTLEGWALRDVANGSALIEGRQGLFEVYAGDSIPRLRRVDAIRRQDGRWVVVTSKGLIVAR